MPPIGALANAKEGDVGVELNRVFEASAAYAAMATKQGVSTASPSVDDRAPSCNPVGWASAFCILLERTFIVKLRDVSWGCLPVPMILYWLLPFSFY